METKALIIGALTITIFIVAFIGFVSVFSNENGLSNPITEDSRLNYAYGNLQNSLNSTYDTYETRKNDTITETTTADFSFGFLMLKSILSLGSVIMNSVIGFFKTILTLPSEVLNIPPIVTNSILAILMIALILAIWKTWKGSD